MAVGRPQPQLRRGEVAQQPLGMRGRNDSIRSALDEQDRCRDLGQLEAPRRDEGDIIVDQPLRSGFRGLARIGPRDFQAPDSAAQSAGVKLSI